MKYSLATFVLRYRNMSLPLKVSFWFFLCSLIQKGLSLLTTPIFTRILSTEDFGIVSVYNAWQQIVIIFATFGLVNSVSNVGLVRYDKDKDGFQSSMIGLTCVFFFVVSVLLLSTYSFTKEIIQLDYALVIIMLADCLLSTFFGMWTLRERFDYRYKKMTILTLINIICGIIFSIFFILHFNSGALGRVFGLVFVSILLGVYSFIDIARRSSKFYNKEYWNFAIKYNLPMIPHFLSMVILSQIDRIMIQNMCNISSVGIYTIAYSSASIILILNQAITASYNPWLLQRLKSMEYDGIMQVVNKIAISYFFVVLLLILFAPEIMAIMAPPVYYDGVYVIPSVACSMFFILLFNLFSPIEYYSMKTKFIGKASIIAAVANILLNIVFINLFGYKAAGYTTLACYIIYAYAHYRYMLKCAKIVGCGVLFDIPFIFKLSLCVIITSLIFTCIYQFDIIRYILIMSLIVSSIFLRKQITAAIKHLRTT